MEKKWKVVITDGRMPNYNHEHEILEPIGAEVVMSGVAYGVRDDEALAAVARDADALMVSQAHIGSEVLDRLEHCKIIVRYGMGVDTLDIPAATERRILVANVTDHCINEVADTALAHILGLARKTTLSDKEVHAGLWTVANLKPIKRISEQYLGLWGCGRIGRNVAKKAAVLGFRVIGYDPYLPPEVAEEAGIQLCEYDEFLALADIVSLHLQLTDETREMVNKDVFAKMKRGTCIVNVSRGQIIKEADLVEAIQSGQLGGAGLDVVAKEPISPDNPLLALNRVNISAHTAWYSEQSNEELQIKAAQIVADALEGRPIATLLNPEVLQA